MAIFLDRYMRGERLAVWRELTALGQEVRHKPYYADAVAVARETMQRARRNVEVLIERLNGIGYRFLTLEAHDSLTKFGTKRVFDTIAEISAKMDPGDKRRFDRLRIMRSPEFRKLQAERSEQDRQAASNISIPLWAGRSPH